MKNKPNFELLKDAYEIIDGIPIGSFFLNSWRGHDAGVTCGTIACAAGWLSLHPKFNALGLEFGPCPTFGVAPNYKRETNYAAIAKLFGIERHEATSLFGPSSLHRSSHKKVFLERVRDFLSTHGQLKAQLEVAGAA